MSVMSTDPLVRSQIFVREVMNSPVVSASPDDSVKDVAIKMQKLKVGSVIIQKGDSATGILTEKDIVHKIVAVNKTASEIKVAEIMSTPLHSINADSDITEDAKILRRFNIKRLGVQYKDELVGIISMSDLTAVTPELVYIVSEKARMTQAQSIRKKNKLAGYCDSCSQWSDELVDHDAHLLCENCKVEPR